MEREKRKEDRRVRKTKLTIERALADLMLEKPVQEITVSELTERADINRGTFYLHYRDIYDLLAQTENDLLERMTEVLHRQQPEALKSGPALKFVEMFRFIEENQQLCRIVLSSAGERPFLETVKGALRESAFDTWEHLYGRGASRVYEEFFTFGIAGCIGIAQQWLEDGCRQPAEEMGRRCNDFLEHGREILRGRDRK